MDVAFSEPPVICHSPSCRAVVAGRGVPEGEVAEVGLVQAARASSVGKQPKSKQ
jgi:hypothetical protein